MPPATPASSTCIAFPAHAAATATACPVCFPQRAASAGSVATNRFVFCVHCGERTAGGDFCGRCGARVDRPIGGGPVPLSTPATYRPAAPAPARAASTDYWAEPRPGQVTAAAVLVFILGGLNLLGAVVVLALSPFADVLLVAGLVLLAIGALQIWIGVGLLQERGWARVAGIVTALVGGLLALVSLLSGSPVSVIGLAIDLAVIVLLCGRAAQEAM